MIGTMTIDIITVIWIAFFTFMLGILFGGWAALNVCDERKPA
jgi:hypothetical protein